MVENAPVPGAQLLAKVTGWAAGKIVDKGLSTMLPGDYTLINILIELSKGTMHMEHFRNPNFYLSIKEREERKVDEQRKIDAIEDPKKKRKAIEKRDKEESKVSEIPEGSQFSLSYENKYVTEHIEYHKRELNPNSNWENNDFCLESLFDINGNYVSYILTVSW